MKKRKLYYLGAPGDGFGWGVANKNLIRELAQLCDLELASRKRHKFDAPIFLPIDRPDLKPPVKYRAPRVMGYAFAEWPLPPIAKHHATQYDIIFAGSTWCAQRIHACCSSRGDEALTEKSKVRVLLQGIDHSLFSPHPPSERKGFTVFSGGKFEFRKGQDLVLAAMRIFMAAHSDVILICSWENQWAQSILSMKNSWLIDFEDPLRGLPEDRVIFLPPVPNEKMAALYAQSHIGLFPNRCEAGTNLVMCEFMACSRPVIATYATGHKDVFGSLNLNLNPNLNLPSYLLSNGQYDPAGWFNAEVSDIVSMLEHAYTHRSELEARGQACAELVQHLTWSQCAQQIVATAFGEVGVQASACPKHVEVSSGLPVGFAPALKFQI